MRNLILIIYNLLFPLLFLLYLPFFLIKLFKRGHFKHGFGERFGIYSADKKRQLAALDKPIWIHAVSVGETVAALSFIRRWTERNPDLQVVLTTTTTTGQKLAREKAPANVVPLYCPIDFCLWVWLAFKRVNPSLLVIFEVEIWPNLVLLARSQGITTALVNGRMSDRSAAGYAKYSPIFKPIVDTFQLICVQSPADRDRIAKIIGPSPKLHVCGTVKFDQTPDPTVDSCHQLFDTIFPDPAKTILVAASTHPGEEELIARTYAALLADHPHLRLVLVPRHAERAAEVEAILATHQLPAIRLTAWRDNPTQTDPPPTVLLGDTTGKLMSIIEASDIIYMGKSLGGQQGGHNIIEPAIFGKPILHGPHMGNFRLVTALFRDANATVEVPDDNALAASIDALLKDPTECQRLAHASRQVVEAQRGATDHTIDLLAQL